MGEVQYSVRLQHRAALEIHDAMERYENPDSESFRNFSSTAAYGNMGQINYSGSNTIIDCLARHRVGIGLPSLTIRWGAWGGIAMAKSLDAASRKRMRHGLQENPVSIAIEAEQAACRWTCGSSPVRIGECLRAADRC